MGAIDEIGRVLEAARGVVATAGPTPEPGGDANSQTVNGNYLMDLRLALEALDDPTRG